MTQLHVATEPDIPDCMQFKRRWLPILRHISPPGSRCPHLSRGYRSPVPGTGCLGVGVRGPGCLVSIPAVPAERLTKGPGAAPTPCGAPDSGGPVPAMTSVLQALLIQALSYTAPTSVLQALPAR